MTDIAPLETALAMLTLTIALVIGLLASGAIAMAAATVFPYQRRFARGTDRLAFLVTTVTTATVALLTFVACGLILLFQIL